MWWVKVIAALALAGVALVAFQLTLWLITYKKRDNP